MNSSMKLIWQRSPVKILIAVAVILLGLGHFEYAAHRIRTQPLRVSITSQGKLSQEANRNGIQQEVFTSEPEIPEIQRFSARLTGENPEGLLVDWEYWKELHPSASKSPDARYFETALLLRTGDPDGAKEVVSALPEEEKNTPRYFLYSGIVSNAANDTLAAVSAYQQALIAQPRYFEAAYNLGVLFFNTGRFDESVDYLQRAIQYAGGLRKAAAYRVLGKSLMQIGRYDSAYEALNESILLEPAAIGARLSLAELLGVHMGRVVEARDLYREILRLDGNIPEVYLGQAELELREGDQDQAVVLLTDALPLFPDSGALRLELAKIYIDLGEYRLALSQLDLIAESAKNYANVLFQRGRVYYQQNKYPSAEEMFRRAYDISDSPFVESLNNLGLVLSAQDRLPEAVEAYEQAISIAPWYGRAFYNLGVARLALEDYEAAGVSFRKALAIDSEYQEAWYNLGVTESLRGNLNSAISAYRQALRLNPNDIKSRLNLAVQHRKLGNEAAALEEYQLVLQLNPEYTSAWFNMALLYRNQNNTVKAEEAYRKTIELEPEQKVYWMNLSALLSSGGRAEEARDLLLRALEVHPDAEELHFNLALQYEELGNPLSALQEYEAAVKLNPFYGRGWKNMGNLLSGLNRHQEAFDAFETAYNLSDTEDSYLEYLAGKELYALGQYSVAARYFDSAVESIQDNEFIWYNAGKAYQSLGNNKKAEEYYSRALSIDPDISRLMQDELSMLEESDEMFLGRIEDDPDNPVWPRQLAELLHRQGRHEEALNVLLEAAGNFPADPQIYTALGRLYAENENWTLAEKNFQYAAELQPGNAEISLETARIYRKQERFDKAESLYRLSMNRVDDPVTVMRELGELYYDQRKYTAAVDILKEAVSLKPAFGPTWMDLGKAYYRNKEYEKAVEPFSRCVDLMPDYAWAYVWKGRVLRKLGQFTEAETEFSKSVELDSRFDQGYLALGDLFREQDKKALALKAYEAALEIDPLSSSIRRRISSVSNQALP